MRRHSKRSFALFAVAGLVALLAKPSISNSTTPGGVYPIVGASWNPNPPPALGPTTVTDFKSGSLIFPLDMCHARSSSIGNSDLDAIVKLTYADTSANRSNKYCNGTSQKDAGMILTYTMLHRIVQAGIPVHWALRAGKTSWHDYDFGITKAGGGPVIHAERNGSGALATDTRFSSLVEIRYAGSAFIIEDTYASAVETLIKTYNQSNSGTNYDTVDIHVAKIDFQAPIYSTIGKLPKLAVLNLEATATTSKLPSEKTGFIEGSIKSALMDDMEDSSTPTGWWDYVDVPSVIANSLINNKYELVWVPAFDFTTTPTMQQQAWIDAITAYVDAGGSVLFQDEAIHSMEGFGSWSGTTYTSSVGPTGAYQSNGGLVSPGINSAWDNGNATETTIGQDYSDPASQFGGNVWTGLGGAKSNWKPRPDNGYHDGVRRMVYTDDSSGTANDDWDVATWRYKDNDSTKGRIYYVGGYNWRRTTPSGFRILMNTIFVHSSAPADTTIEVSKSGPIVTTTDGTELHHQGTYEYDTTGAAITTYNGSGDDTTFQFPHTAGHLRAISTSDLSSTDTDFDDITPLWDAADGIPTTNVAAGCTRPLNGTCRHVFTTIDKGNISTSTKPTMKDFIHTNLSDIKPLLAPSLTNTENQTLMSRIVQGRETAPGSGVYESKLGGVERSTMAIIEASTVTGTVRPTMVYFGAMDGMLHAVCADTLGTGCPSKGAELWAFIPRTQLGRLRLNTQVINGSIKVAEVFDDFGSGRNEWKTILTFQTGSGDATTAATAPAVYAMDITDPTNPEVLWEYSAYWDGTRDTIDLGIGLNQSMGPVETSNGKKYATFVQTNNDGTSSASSKSGFYFVMLDTRSGKELFTPFTYEYTDKRSLGNPLIKVDAVPGGAVAVDFAGQATINRVLLSSIYGDLWVIDATTGKNLNQDTSSNEIPLFRFSKDFMPIGASPTVYFHPSTGKLHAIVVSGGYVDYVNGNSWGLTNVIQMGVTIPIALTATTPYNETSIKTVGGVTTSFPLGQRAFAQATVVGNEVFIVTDSTDVNAASFGIGGATGTLRRYSLNDGASSSFGTPASGPTTITISGGASSVDATTAGVVYTGGGKQASKLTVTGFDAAGKGGAELSMAESYARKLWLRLR